MHPPCMPLLVQDDVSTLELWVYEEAGTLGEEANVYVHHELMLPAFPLCLAWLDCPIVRQHGRCVHGSTFYRHAEVNFNTSAYVTE